MNSATISDSTTPTCIRTDTDTRGKMRYLMPRSSGRWLIDHIEPIARTLPESRLEQLETLFVRGVGYEYMFWDSAYRMQMQWKKEWQ